MSRFVLGLALVAVVLAAPDVPNGFAGQPPPAPPAAEPVPPFGAVQIGTTQFRHRGWHTRVFLTDGGKTMIVVSEGPVVRFWDVETGAKLDEIPLKGSYHAAAFAPDGDLLAVVGTHSPQGDNGKYEGLLTLIDTAARKQLHAVGLPGNSGGNSQKVRVSADGKRVVVEYEGDVRVIDGKTGDELLRHKGRINAGALAASPDGKRIAFGRFDVFLWHWETGEEPKKFTSLTGFGTESLEFSPDGKTLHIVPSGNMIISWDVATGKQTGSQVLEYHPGQLAFSPDGTTVAIPSLRNAAAPTGGHAISLLDKATWEEVGRIPVGPIGVTDISWSKDGSRIAGVTDYVAKAWDVKTGKMLGADRAGHAAMIVSMAFAPDGTLFTASDDHTIRSWNPNTGKPGLELVHDYWVRGIALSPDGSLVAGSSLRNDLRLWDTKTGQPRFRLLGNGKMGGRRVVRFTPDGTRLVAWGDDAIVRVWDVRTGKLLAENSTRPADEKIDPDDPAADRMLLMMRIMTDAADISPDGTTLVLSEGKDLRLLDPMTGKERQTLTPGETSVSKVAFSPDGKRLLVASGAKRIEIKLPDGRTRSTVEDTYPVSVWDVATGKQVWAASAEGSWPGLAYSPDGTRVAMASNVWQGPNRVWVWDAASGKELGRIELPRPGHYLAFSADGKRLAVSLQDTTALVYDLEIALKAPEKKEDY